MSPTIVEQFLLFPKTQEKIVKDIKLLDGVDAIFIAKYFQKTVHFEDLQQKYSNDFCLKIEDKY